MKAILIALLLTTFTVVNGGVVLTSCARMDTPVLSKAAQGLCITSCKYQNCGTGFCQKVGGRPTCTCRRCANGGGSWPVITLGKLNCGTGFCQKVGGRPTCMCRRCANGGGSWPVIPLDTLVKLALKRGKR
uniref:Laminin EGF-like domain-containing protein n=1 Tax=Ascaris lumbricoides TaxID=6252 RepID=A0A0M3IDE2_ASCLU